MPDYQDGKIYKIVNDEMPDMVYYGSTCNTFVTRLRCHKNKASHCKSKVLFEYGNPQMILIEKYPCNDKMELTQRERYYIENNECVNKNVPNRTIKEYREDNKEKLLLKSKEYHEKNKEKEKQYREENKDKRKEYLEANKEHFSNYKKQWNETNKEKVALKKGEKFSCDCGGKYTHGAKARHFKSKKHLKYIQTL